MNTKKTAIRSLPILVSLTSLLCLNNFLEPAYAADANTAKPTPTVINKQAVPSLQVLESALSEYQSQPSDVTWTVVQKVLESTLEEASNKKYSSADLVATVPALSSLGTRVLDGGHFRIWQFPKVSSAQDLIIEFSDSSPSPTTSKTTSAKPAPTAKWKVGSVKLGLEFQFKDARIFNVSPSKESTESGKFLVVAGVEPQRQTVLVKGFKLIDGQFKDYPAMLSSVPPYLLGNLSGKVAFSGNNIVITLNSNFSNMLTPESTNTSANGAASSTYKLVLKQNGSHYQLEGKWSDDNAYNVVCQFLKAVENGQMDMAKTYLVDPTLVSIPRYVGISARNSTKPFRLISMASPATGGLRFRLVTFAKDDLILDVSKVKAQWAIKSIFIVPADQFLLKVANDLSPYNHVPLALTDTTSDTKPSTTSSDKKTVISQKQQAAKAH